MGHRAPTPPLHPLWATFPDQDLEGRFEDGAWRLESHTGGRVVLFLSSLLLAAAWLDLSLPSVAASIVISAHRLMALIIALLVHRLGHGERRVRAYDAAIFSWVVVVTSQLTLVRLLRGAQDTLPGGAAAVYVLIAAVALSALPLRPRWLLASGVLILVAATAGLSLLNTPPTGLFIGLLMMLAIVGSGLIRARALNIQRRRAWWLQGRLEQANTRLREANEQVLELFDANRQAMKELQHQAETDPLTGAFNRRGGIEQADEMIAGAPCSVLAVDIDHFKQINDRFGHAAGDQALISVVHLARACCREGDLVVRWGGDELMLVVRDPDERVGPRIARELVERSRSHPIACDQAAFQMTLSIGVAHGRGASLGATIARADEAMYAAKGSGRDRVVTTEDLALAWRGPQDAC